MPARHFLRCLGLPELRGPGGEPIRFRTRKHLALLVFLAAERRQSHPRERLAELLWPDARPSEGRHSLATALSVIRGKLGPRTFETTRDAVRLVAADLEVDLERLAKGEILGTESALPLEVAGFLDDFEVTRAPEYMLWRDIMRARWFPQIRAALILLMDRCRRTGDFNRIETHADRLLVLDELCEDGIRGKMEARAFAGDRLSAIRIFQTWRTRLREELDATPSGLVEGMALRLRQRGYEPPGTSHIPTVPTDQWRNRAFVGRAAQYQVLYERWERTNGGEGRHGLVLGESGIGKTTLVERLVTAAGLEGAVSSRVQCYEVEREIPYAAIGSLVRGLLDRPGAGGTPPEWLAELARTCPGVAHRYPNLPPARETVGETARLRLTEAVHELCSAVADEHPVILIVDDVHLADDASVAVLHLIMRRTQEQPIMVIMTAREAELAGSPHAGRLMESRESLALEPVELPPLSDEEMNEVITALAAEALVPPAIRRAMLRAATGIPMLVELLFDDWRTNGEGCLALSVGAMTVDALGQPTQEVYRRVFERVFRDLSPAARAVVNLAAILGERLNDLAMYELVDLTLAQTLTGMSELAALRVLRDGGREVEFRNEVFRNYTYLNVPSPLRRALHGLIADRLLKAEAAGEKVPGLMLAWHCFRAGRPLEAEPYLLRGCSESLRRGGTFEVELALRSAMGRLSTPSEEGACLLLAEALQEQDRHAEALQVTNGSQTESKRNTIECTIVRARSHAATVSSRTQAAACFDSIEHLLSDDTARPIWPSVLEILSEVCYVYSDDRRAAKLLSQAKQLSPADYELQDRARLGTSLALLARLTQDHCLLSTRLQDQLELIRLCRAEGYSNETTWKLCVSAACLQTGFGKYEQGAELAAVAYDIAARLGNERRMSSSATNLAICHLRLGNYLASAQWSERAGTHAERQRDGWRRIQPTYYGALAACLMGDNRRGLELGESILGLISVVSPGWQSEVFPLMASDVLWAAGECDRATKLARASLENSSPQLYNPAFVGMGARWMALTSLECNQIGPSRQALLQLTLDLDSYDVMDRAEILSASLLLEKAVGQSTVKCYSRLAETLSELPAPVEVQLRRLGMLRS